MTGFANLLDSLSAASSALYGASCKGSVCMESSQVA